MRFQLNLIPFGVGRMLPANYQYPLSAAIYKIIQHADEQYAAFLHDQGYGHGKSFKLFTFSDLRVPFRNQGDRLLITGSSASLTIAFHIDAAATNFIKGLFINQHIEIADIKSRVQFTVSEVQLLPDLFTENNYEAEVLVQPLSPLVTGRKNSRGHYDFRGPTDIDFTDCIIYNWIEKYRAINGNIAEDTTTLSKSIHIKVLLQQQELKQRLISIKAFTPEETRIRGYTKFRMQVKAPKPLLELAMNAGLGLYNAQGMGCVGVV